MICVDVADVLIVRSVWQAIAGRQKLCSWTYQVDRRSLICWSQVLAGNVAQRGMSCSWPNVLKTNPLFTASRWPVSVLQRSEHAEARARFAPRAVAGGIKQRVRNMCGAVVSSRVTKMFEFSVSLQDARDTALSLLAHVCLPSASGLGKVSCRHIREQWECPGHCVKVRVGNSVLARTKAVAGQALTAANPAPKSSLSWSSFWMRRRLSG